MQPRLRGAYKNATHDNVGGIIFLPLNLKPVTWLCVSPHARVNNGSESVQRPSTNQPRGFGPISRDTIVVGRVRFERGLAQLIDWAWRIDLESQPSATLEQRSAPLIRGSTIGW